MIRTALAFLVLAGCAPPVVSDTIGPQGLSVEIVLPPRDPPTDPTVTLDEDGALRVTFAIDVDGADWRFFDPATDTIGAAEEGSAGHWHYKIPEDNGTERMAFAPTQDYDSSVRGDTWTDGDSFTVLVTLRDAEHVPIEVDGEEVSARAEWTVRDLDGGDTDTDQ